jgi:GDP/UDP-N,N'-diacetylbacillosamine 2-epimerase (hydrolysing)
MKPRVLFFSGNRAEFGYLLPFFIEMHDDFKIDFLIAGGHLLPPWNTITEIETSLTQHKLPLTLLKITPLQHTKSYTDSFAHLHQETSNVLMQKHYDYAFVMGDRPESFAFASAIFLHNIPLIHYGGGDVTDNAYYLDSNIRHAITKMSHLHFTLSDDAATVVKQLGEEAWRVTKAGISTYDYERLHLLETPQKLQKKFPLFKPNKELLIFTYHPVQYRSAQENLNDFLMLLELVTHTKIPTLLTYPNNDTGSEKIINFLEKNSLPSHITSVKNLGTPILLALYKYAKAIVIGNSSSGVLETVLFCAPTLNIGDRQGNRKRSANIIDAPLEPQSIKEQLSFLIKNYDTFKEHAAKDAHTFGSGEAARIITEKLKQTTLTKERLLFKKFVQI